MSVGKECFDCNAILRLAKDTRVYKEIAGKLKKLFKEKMEDQAQITEKKKALLSYTFVLPPVANPESAEEILFANHKGKILKKIKYDERKTPVSKVTVTNCQENIVTLGGVLNNPIFNSEGQKIGEIEQFQERIQCLADGSFIIGYD